VATVSVTYGVMAIYNRRISNEIDSYTYLNFSIRLTKVGDIPSETLQGVPYTYHIITENLNPTKSYKCRTVFEISNGYYVYPLYPEPPTPVNITIYPPPYNYSFLSPDMVTLHYKTHDVNLTLDETRNVLVGYTETFTASIRYYDDALVTVTFNESAMVSTNYYIRTWVELIA
jgi:hypothetical protein